MHGSIQLDAQSGLENPFPVVYQRNFFLQATIDEIIDRLATFLQSNRHLKVSDDVRLIITINGMAENLARGMICKTVL